MNVGSFGFLWSLLDWARSQIDPLVWNVACQNWIFGSLYLDEVCINNYNDAMLINWNILANLIDMMLLISSIKAWTPMVGVCFECCPFHVSLQMDCQYAVVVLQLIQYLKCWIVILLHVICLLVLRRILA